MQGICVYCNKNKQQAAKKSTLGYKKYCKGCSTCLRIKYKILKKSIYRKSKKPHCEKCGFVAEDPCQLDVHHIDRNHSNNLISNLQTLCANCHRLEHKEDRKFWAQLSDKG